MLRRGVRAHFTRSWTHEPHACLLKECLALQAGEVVDATRMNKAALCNFFEKEIENCFKEKLMMSLHLKATMMKACGPCPVDLNKEKRKLRGAR